MTTGTFGESLKREREMRGVALEEISAATRIATRFLQAIENEQWDQLPGGVFNRGFVRAMARYLGLDEEKTVAEYTLAVGDRPTVPVWTGSPPVVTPELPWLAWIIAVAVILALIAGGWFGTRWLLARRAARKTAIGVEMGGDASPSPASALQPAAARSTFSSADANPASSMLNTPSNASSSPAAASSSASAGAPASQPADAMELKISVSKRTKATVVADKDLVFDGTMKAGENHFFSATDHFQVTAKDAAALQLVLNGKPLAFMGPAGQPGKITLTRDALRGASGGGN